MSTFRLANLSLARLLRWAALCLLAAITANAGAFGQTLAPVTILHEFKSNGINPRAPLVRGADGAYYGTTAAGGRYNLGTVFRVAVDGTITDLVDFSGSNGATPKAALLLASDGSFYGTTSAGGTGLGGGSGTVFRLTPAGALTTLADFGALASSGVSIADPEAALLEGGDGFLYGTSVRTLTASTGTIFKITPAGAVSVLVTFTGANGSRPAAALIRGSDGNFYGTTKGGGTGVNLGGTVFKVTPAGALTPLVNFPGRSGFSDFGDGPGAPLLLGGDGAFYGTTIGGGDNSFGSVFRLSADGVTLSTLHSFNFDGNGYQPQSAVVDGGDGFFYGTTSGGTVFKVTAAGGFTLLASPGFNVSALLKTPAGAFLGATDGGGTNNLGRVFQVTTAGALTTLASFIFPEGASPAAALTLAPDGSFYGVNSFGGLYGGGTAFRLLPDGTVQVLHHFNVSDGAGIYPLASLTLGKDGNFYGVNSISGLPNHGDDSYAFRLTTGGAVTALATFPDLQNDANQLSLDPVSGLLYGTTQEGGSTSNGTLFSLTTSGTVSILYSFPASPNVLTGPRGRLVRAASGTFYGVTANGGASNHGAVFTFAPGGTVGTLLSFDGTNGSRPVSAPVFGSDGNLYGITAAGGVSGAGALYRLTLTGTLTILASGSFDTSGALGESGASASEQLTLSPTDSQLYGLHYGVRLADNSFVTTIFRLTTAGALTDLASFGAAAGVTLRCTVAAGANGAIYGTAINGGSAKAGSLFLFDPTGTLPTPTPTPTVTPTPTPQPTPTPTPTPGGPTPTPTPTPGGPTPTPTPASPPPTPVPPTPTPTPPAPPAPPAIFGLSTNSGGAAGSVGLTITGTSFQPGATVSLVAAGLPAIAAGTVTAGAGGAALTVNFDLSDQQQGAYDLVVVNPDGQRATLAGAFTVQAPSEPDIYVDIVGRVRTRTGQPSVFTILYGNTGNTDVLAVPLTITFPKGIAYKFVTPLAAPPNAVANQTTPDYSLVPAELDQDPDVTIVPLLLPKIRAGETGAVEISLTVPDDPKFESATFDVQAFLSPPLLDNTGAGGMVLSAYYQKQFKESPVRRDLNFPANPRLNCLRDIVTEAISAVGINSSVGLATQAVLMVTNTIVTSATGPVSMQSVVVDCAFAAAAIGAVALGPEAAAIIAAGGSLYALYQFAMGFPMLLDECNMAFNPDSPTKSPGKPKRPRGSHKHKPTTNGKSSDPNDLTGNVGDGSAAHYLSERETLSYAVYFENQPTATLPAQTVTVTEPLDVGAVDLNTFAFGPIGFGDKVAAPPPGLIDYQTTVDLRPANNLLVAVGAHLDKASGVIRWTFASLDPATGLPTTDPAAGFLPPNVTPPQGDGFLIFTVKPRLGLPTNRAISTQASIVFDVNAPILTPIWTVTLDNTPPVSLLTALPKKSKSSHLVLDVQSTDEGGGAGDFLLYVSENKGEFLFLAEAIAGTPLEFTGVTGRRYDFFVQAKDTSGNVEPLKGAAETGTKIVGPDLVGEWTKAVAKTTPDGRHKLKGTLVLRNQSPNKPTLKGGTLRFYLSDDAVLDPSDLPLGKPMPFEVLPGGGAVTLKLKNFILPADATVTGRRLLAVIDAKGKVDETDDENNTAASDPLP